MLRIVTMREGPPDQSPLVGDALEGGTSTQTLLAPATVPLHAFTNNPLITVRIAAD